MADTGWQEPAVVDSWNEDGDLGAGAWTNPSNAQLDDASYALSRDFGAASAGTPEVLRATGFDFSAISPSDSIDGFALELKAKQATGVLTYRDDRVQLVLNGVAVGTNQGVQANTINSTSDQTFTWGGASDKLGFTGVTAADVLDPDFGWFLDLVSFGFAMGVQQAGVNVMRMKVYYSVSNSVGLIGIRRPTRRTDLDFIFLTEGNR